jgi:hypothetical protein
MTKTYTVTIEVDDYSGSDGEDIEEILDLLFSGELPEGLPRDLAARIIEITDEEI